MIPGSLGGKDSAQAAYSIELVSGRVDVDIDASIRPIYGLIVRAPRKVAAVVKSGNATLAVSPVAVTVAARSGRALMVGHGDRWRPLRTGQAFTVSDTDTQGAHRAIIPAPTVQLDSSLSLVMGEAFTPQHLSWSKVPTSKGYIVRLYCYVAQKPALIRQWHVEDQKLALGALPAGRYGASVSAIDGTHLESAASPVIDFNVVRAVLPPGAELDANTVRLPSTERLRFEDTQGLEVSYSRHGGDFVPVPPSIGLGHGKGVSLRLRLKGSLQETRLTLEPLDLLPTVEIGPAHAIWPGPPVTISVKVQHPDGRPADTQSAVSATVTVNNEVVDVAWLRERGKMSCQVEKPATPGPWVVRVRLSDPRGHDLGRDFLEVAPQSANR
jgi:hypothetical protein